jgi:ATP-binding cassette, subfamily C (CFTR/MRP), member 1
VPSVDLETDAKMQEIIHSEFKDHTIIVIAHRLSSLLDFDHVAVLDAGRLVEFGKPRDLLEVPTSNFSRLYGAKA